MNSTERDGPCVSLAAPAKLNLELRVLGRRPDGFHELDTTLVAVDLEDRLEARLRPTPGVGLELDGPAATADVPRDASNLVVRAVLELLGDPPRDGVQLSLYKRIPSQAGLGGGSSDAAAAARAVARLLRLDRRPDASGASGASGSRAAPYFGPTGPLVRALARIGSDCAFFESARETGLARCTGRGERVEPLRLEADGRVFCIVTPSTTCSTAAVYRAWDPADRDPRPALEACSGEPWFGLPVEEARSALINELEPAALRSHPKLARFRARLDRAGGGHFRLAGSGSSFFGLFSEADAAEDFLERFAAREKDRNDGLRGRWIVRPWAAGSGT